MIAHSGDGSVGTRRGAVKRGATPAGEPPMTSTLTTARPRAAASKREAILDATLRLVARTGLHNTPISAIAREAGVAVGTAYLYFASKDELINELYLELVRA